VAEESVIQEAGPWGNSDAGARRPKRAAAGVGEKRRQQDARTTQGRATCGTAAGRGPADECMGAARRPILEYRRCGDLSRPAGTEHLPGLQRIHAVFSHQGETGGQIGLRGRVVRKGKGLARVSMRQRRSTLSPGGRGREPPAMRHARRTDEHGWRCCAPAADAPPAR